MAEKHPPIDYRTHVVRKPKFTLLGETYVDLRAIVAFEPSRVTTPSAMGDMTRIYLDCGHVIVVDVPPHRVRNIMESK